LYVQDGAEGLIKSLELKQGNYFFNIGVNKGISILEMSNLIATIIGWNGTFTFDKTKPDGAMEKRVMSKFPENYLNWSPKTNFETGVINTIKWYEKNVLNL